MVFFCHRTVSMAAVYQLKIKYDQDKFGVVFLEAKCLVSFPLKDKHIVNEHHVVQKSHDATEKICLHMVHFNISQDWFETKFGIKNVSLNTAKRCVGVAVYWEE